MSQVITTKKTRKKQSPFEKMWARAINLKKGNEKLEAELAELVERMLKTILPKEIENVKAQTPLLQKLLTLGQRKSLTNWERASLDDWICSLTEEFNRMNLIDNDLRDHLARYDAYRLGIELEDDSIAPHVQLIEKVQQFEEEQRQQHEREEQAIHEQIKNIREEKIKEAKAEVERILDKTLGPRPVAQQSATPDLWEDELASVQDQTLEQYDKKRETLRKELMEDKLEHIEEVLKFTLEDPDDIDMDFPDLDEILESVFNDSDFNDQYTTEKPAPTKADAALSNDTFQQLFRATAAKLHPDREPDPDLRLEKQKLMATLLKARKTGDLLTVLDLYETWVGEHKGFSNKDKKALEATLRAWIDRLEEERAELVSSDPLYFRAHQRFYRSTKKSTDNAFAKYLSELQNDSDAIEVVTADIKSLKTLKPWLVDRYNRMMDNRFVF